MWILSEKILCACLIIVELIKVEKQHGGRSTISSAVLFMSVSHKCSLSFYLCSFLIMVNNPRQWIQNLLCNFWGLKVSYLSSYPPFSPNCTKWWTLIVTCEQEKHWWTNTPLSSTCTDSCPDGGDVTASKGDQRREKCATGCLFLIVWFKTFPPVARWMSFHWTLSVPVPPCTKEQMPIYHNLLCPGISSMLLIWYWETQQTL